MEPSVYSKVGLGLRRPKGGAIMLIPISSQGLNNAIGRQEEEE